MAASLSRDLIFLILQFLDEEKFKETLHTLEQESALFFNFKYFEEQVLNGNWDEAERYLLGFTRFDENRFSMKTFFELRKQKYLEALDKLDRASAVDILLKDLRVFSSFNQDLFKEFTQLITLDNFRENDSLSNYRDTNTARAIMMVELKRLIDGNPALRDKTEFPNLRVSRLRSLVYQSLNWQHSLCENPVQNPELGSLFVDHNCRNSRDLSQMSASSQFVAPNPRLEGFHPIGGATGLPFHPQPPSLQTPITTWMPNSSNILRPVLPGGVNYSGLTYPGAMAKGLGGTDEMCRLRMAGIPDKVIPSAVCPTQSHNSAVLQTHDLPKTVIRTLTLWSNPTSMDFHPIHQMLLLVGTSLGDVSLWDVRSIERLFARNFQVWDIGASSMTLKATLVKDPSISVRRILWNSKGSLFGVAYSKNMIQLYSYHDTNDIRPHLEIEAHVGSVNDLAFCNPTTKLCLLTCGDDKTIKLWDATTGVRVCNFEGHDSAVYSVCPHYKENIHFLFSTSVDGKIKAWLYDTLSSRVDFDAPGRSCTTMTYSADGTRLFSCGTNKGGESHIVEWNEKEGTIKRSYQGLHKHSLVAIQFDMTKNQFLAAGHDHSIKFWDMDNVNLLTSTDAEGGLPASPRVRFNKDGTLLAVTANDNKIKVLATVNGQRLMHQMKNGEVRTFEDVKPKLTKALVPPKTWKFTEINEASQFRSLRLATSIRIEKILRLMYTSTGSGILALASNAIHLFWKWPRNDLNPSGKATTKVAPQVVQPTPGAVMINDLTDSIAGEAVPCFALSKNDSYLMSASGGKVSLFNMLTFKIMTSCMSPPPAATSLAFHPIDNNTIAVGTDDNSIHIYNVRTDEISHRLSGHSKKVTGLAFSHVQNLLISSGEDAQIIRWNSNTWEKENNTFLQIPERRTPRTNPAKSDIFLQFHQDHAHFLVAHESQIAIYETSKLQCVKQWTVGEFMAPISHATFSSNCQLIYTSFIDGVILIFSTSNLQLQCQINPSAYLGSSTARGSGLYPFVIAANPQDPNQFALGLTDGGVQVIEPLESEGKWGVPSPAENGSSNTMTSCISIG
ncbi:topless-related protein 1 isoform X2 [Neltuma alba]|uniref:topless-related protein 1 isoform X2 n=1 Tax=Neltuma alba TaxID=207710 RepID=UPI0010A336AE|nr:topless-related protein 1-like isoform X2 [Prosopis alba]